MADQRDDRQRTLRPAERDGRIDPHQPVPVVQGFAQLLHVLVPGRLLDGPDGADLRQQIGALERFMQFLLGPARRWIFRHFITTL